MAVLKKYNPETGQYENTNVIFLNSKDGSIMNGSKKTVTLESISTSTNSDGTYTSYVIKNIKKNDVITTVNLNGGRVFLDSSNNNITSLGTSKFYDNYSWCLWTFVATQDYDSITVSAKESILEKHTPSLTYTLEKYRNLPSFNDEIIPTMNDEESSDIKTLTSKKIYELLGSSEIKAKENLTGGVWIALGDSYTVHADSNFKAIAEKYGMIYDGRGVVSSTICGDDTGNKGYRAFHYRMDDFIEEYTGDGHTVNDVAYTADDVKLITFMGGANDGFGKDTWIGSRTSMNPYYIYGACNYMFRKLRENFPNAQIICILQPANYSDDMSAYTTDETAQKLGFVDLAEMQAWDMYSFCQYKMETKERVVKECAERFGIPVVDCIFNWYSVVNPTHRSLYWNTDKIHLSTLGTQELSNKLELEIIKQCGRI